MSKMLRINEAIYDQLQELIDISGESRQEILEKALDILKREYLLNKANQQYESLKKDKEFLKEQKEWDSTLLDKLDED